MAGIDYPNDVVNCDKNLAPKCSEPISDGLEYKSGLYQTLGCNLFSCYGQGLLGTIICRFWLSKF